MSLRESCRKALRYCNITSHHHMACLPHRGLLMHTLHRPGRPAKAKISIGWKNTYGCCGNEYDLWQVVWVCLKRAAHFKKNGALCDLCYLRQFLNQISFFFSFQIGRGFRDTPGNSKSSVRFCLQVESKGNCNSDNCLKGSLKHSVLFQLKDLHPLAAQVSPQKNVFYVRTHVSDAGSLNIHFIKAQ